MAACTVGRVDLVDLVDFSGVECLNAAEGSWANVLKAGYREDEGAPPPVRLSARLPARPPAPPRCFHPAPSAATGFSPPGCR